MRKTLTGIGLAVAMAALCGVYLPQSRVRPAAPAKPAPKAAVMAAAKDGVSWSSATCSMPASAPP